MSPSTLGLAVEVLGFPRVSGDEPWMQAMDRSGTRFSPRERG